MAEAEPADRKMPAQAGIVCAGNWIVDMVLTIDHWPQKNDLARIEAADHGIGGGAANVFTNLAGLRPDLPLIPVGCIGDDAYAEVVLHHCKSLGADTASLKRIANVATAHTHVMTVPGDSRTFFYAGGANDFFGRGHVEIDNLAKAGARLFYLGYILLLAEMDRLRSDGGTAAADSLAEARQAGLITCVDLVSVHHAHFSQIVAVAAPHIDYLIVNENEAARASGIELPGQNPASPAEMMRAVQRAAQKLLQMGVNQAVIIHTPDFAVWTARDGTQISDAACPLDEHNIASPVGAGDAFCSGILYGIHEGFKPATSLKLAHRLAAINLAMPTANGGIPEIGSLVEA
tara:strand:- start:2942 stop:3979 length:1038 start_codon:yes stop_codon:yes gene_type:complete